MVFSYAGTGRMPQFVAVKALGLISYSYTSAIEEQFLYLDFGALGRAYWVIADHATKVIQDYKDDQIVDLVESGGPLNQLDYGSIAEVEAYATDDWGEITVTSNIQAMGRTHFHSLTTWSVIKTWVGTGTVWEMDGGTRYRLDAPWIGSGTLRPYGSANTHYVPAIATEGLLPLRSDTKVAYAPNWNAFGTLFSGSFAGEAVTKVFPEDPNYTIRQGSLTTLTAADLDSSYNAVYEGTRYMSSSGAGTSPTNGFAVGPHVRFGTASDPGDSSSTSRKVEYTLDLTNVEEITFRLVMGNGSNGGETPDNGEDLWMRFLYTGLSLNDASRKLLDNTETTYTTPGDKTVTVPEVARKFGAQIRIYQLTWSGTYQYDHYGFISLSYEGSSLGDPHGDGRGTLFNVGGDALILSSLRHIGSGTLFNISNTQSLRTFAYDGSGTLFGFGNETRSLTYAYPGTDFFTYEDYGQVAATTTQPNEDFGSLFRDPGDDVYEIFDRGEILVNYTKYPHGLFKLRSDTLVNFIPNYNGSGTIKVQGEVFIFVPPIWEGEGTIILNNEASSAVGIKESGFGRISTLSGAAETVTASPDEEDKLLNFRGVASQSRSATPAVEGLDVKISDAAFVRFIPKYAGFAHLNIDGGLLEEKVTFAHLGTGRLFDFIGADEKRVYNYTSSSIDFITHPSYGFVTDAATTFEDYGDLDLRYTGETGWISTPDISVDYHGILDNYTNYPFGVFPLKGEAHASKSFEYIASGPLFVFTGEVELRFPPFHAGNVDIAVHGEVVEKRSKSYIGLQSLQISGAGSEAYVPNWNGSGTIFASGEPRVRFSLLHIGDGKLFDITGASAEVRTRGYQGTGVISTLSGAAEAFSVSPSDLFSLFDVTGVAEFSRSQGHQGSGTLFNLSGASESKTSDEVFDTLFNVFGEVDVLISLRYHGSGSIFSLGGAAERVAYVPSISADLNIGGIVSDSTTKVHEGSGILFGLSGASESKTSDEVFTTLFNINGASSEVRTRGYEGSAHAEIFSTDVIEKATFDYVGSGVVSTLSGSAESFTVNPDERQVLLDFRGTSIEKFVANPPDITTSTSISGEGAFRFIPIYIGAGVISVDAEHVERVSLAHYGSGDLFTFSSTRENVVYSYNNSSVDYFIPVDFGSVSLSASTPAEPVALYTETDFGTLDLRYTGETGWMSTPDDRQDWQYILENYNRHPFGLFERFKGAAADAVNRIYIGSGNLYRLRGSGVLTLPNVHSSTGGFEIFGAATSEKIGVAESFNVLFEASGSASVLITNAEQPDVEIELDGKAGVSFTGNTVQDATIFFTGASTEVRSRGYEGTGFISTLSGAVEAFTASPDNLFSLFDITGQSVIRTTQAHEGFGTVFNLSGASITNFSLLAIGGGDTSISGEAVVVATRRYKGTGVISTLSGSAQTFTASPDNLFSLFDVTGQSVFRTTQAHQGFGTLFGFSGASESATFREVFNTLLIITGEGKSSFTPNFNGSGFISTLSGAAEAFAASPDDLFSLFDLTGSVSDSTTKSFVGSGSLFGLSGSTEAFTRNAVEREALFTFSGAAHTRLNPKYIGHVHLDIDGGLVTEKVTLAHPVTGSLFKFIGADERRVYSYNNSSIDFLVPIDLGSVAAIPSTNAEPIALYTETDFGTLDIAYTGEQGWFSTPDDKQDWQHILENYTRYPFGLFERFSGTAVPIIKLSHIGSGITKVFGEAKTNFTPNFNGSGFISTLSGAAESFTVNPDERQVLFDVTGQGEIRATLSHIGFGNLFGFSGAAESRAVDEVFTTLLNVNGEANIVSARRYKGTGFISTLSGAAESFTVNPTERELLFSISGLVSQSFSFGNYRAEGTITVSGQLAKTENLTFAEQPEVQARISGAGTESYVPNYNGSGRITTLFGAASSRTINTRVPGALFDVTGFATQAFSFGNYEGETTARIFREDPLTESRTFVATGFGRFTIFGEGEYARTQEYIGLGQIFSKGIGGESVTRRIPAFQADLALSGFAGKAVTFNPPDITTHLRITGDAAPAAAFVESFTVRLATDGTARESFVPSYIGDGAIASRGIGGEAISRRLPAFQADMFVSGFAGQKTTVREQFFGSLFTFTGSSAPELLAFAEEPEVQVEVGGESRVRFSLLHIGEGRISTLSGAAESATFNPRERELLFSFGGGVSDIQITKAESKQVEVSVTGEATEVKFIPNWIVEGTIPVIGIADTSRSVVYTGEGFISTLSGAAESFTYNPAEDTALFTFLGTASIRSAVSEVKTINASIFNEDVEVYVIRSFIGSGDITVLGQTDDSTARVYEGTGIISTLSGSAESFTVNPDDITTLFGILGIADTRPIQVFTKIGSGTLFSSFTAGEARVISVPINVPSQESKGLFKLEGTSPESFTIPYEGSGTLFSFEGLEERRTFAHQTEGTVTLSGVASTPRTRDHIGSGSLFSFIEAASAVRFITSTRTVLFDITGESVFRTTQAHEGTGSLFTTFTAGESRTYKLPEHLVPNIVFKGAARIKNTFLYQGQTNLQVSGSAQESFTPRVYEGDVRLKTSGESSQKFVTAETSQGGTVKVRGAATFLITNAFQTYTLFDIVGVANVTKSAAFSGSGTIFTIGDAREVAPGIEFEGSGTITLFGKSIDKKVDVAPERTYGWII